jgi:hypothetical protein
LGKRLHSSKETTGGVVAAAWMKALLLRMRLAFA